MPIRKLISALQQSQNLQDIHGVCRQACEDWEWDYFLYAARIPAAMTKPRYAFVSGLPDPWWQRYSDQEYLFQDPTFHHCVSNTTPLYWDDVLSERVSTAGDINILREASEFGLCQGVSIPIHSSLSGSGLFSVASSDSSPEDAEAGMEVHLPKALMFSTYLHERVASLLVKSDDNSMVGNVSARERECLLWAAEGKTTWETAQILNISERTVLFHMQNAMKKLGANNKSHAVARAIHFGVISSF
jgi:LuxR family transcriptional activator of bioluminescence operon